MPGIPLANKHTARKISFFILMILNLLMHPYRFHQPVQEVPSKGTKNIRRWYGQYQALVQRVPKDEYGKYYATVQVLPPVGTDR